MRTIWRALDETAGACWTEARILAEAGSLMDALQVPDLLGSVPDISDPTPPLKAGVEGIKSALDGLSGVGPALSDLFGS